MPTHAELDSYVLRHITETLPLYSTLSVIEGCTLAYNQNSLDGKRNSRAPQGFLLEAVGWNAAVKPHYFFYPRDILPAEVQIGITLKRELAPEVQQWVPPMWGSRVDIVPFDIGRPVYFRDLAKENARIHVPYPQSPLTQKVDRVAFWDRYHIALAPAGNPPLYELRTPLEPLSVENCPPLSSFVAYHPHLDLRADSTGARSTPQNTYEVFFGYDKTGRREILAQRLFIDKVRADFQRGENYRVYGVVEIAGMEDPYGPPEAVALGGIVGPLPRKVDVRLSPQHKANGENELWVRVATGELVGDVFRLKSKPSALRSVATEIDTFGYARIEVVRRSKNSFELVRENTLHPMLRGRPLKHG